MTVESEVRAISAAWDTALIANDVHLLAGFMTDDWVLVGPEGPATKAEVVGWIDSGRLVHHTMTAVDEGRLARAGDALLMTTRKLSSGLWEGSPYAADEWISEVYVPAGGSWRCVFSQKTAAA
ncbi:nuclear transport factor 2 family protein [Glycomyces tarimensis]